MIFACMRYREAEKIPISLSLSLSWRWFAGSGAVIGKAMKPLLLTSYPTPYTLHLASCRSKANQLPSAVMWIAYRAPPTAYVCL